MQSLALRRRALDDGTSTAALLKTCRAELKRRQAVKQGLMRAVEGLAVNLCILAVSAS